MNKTSIEFQLACLCSQVDADDQSVHLAQQLLQSVSVSQFTDLVVRRHRIGPLVHATLSSGKYGVIPNDLMAPLVAEARANAAKALRSQRAHVLIARGMRASGLGWLAFKGVTLAARYYPSVSHRHVNDIDFWVDAASHKQARAVLAALGFAKLDEEDRWCLAERGPRHAGFLSERFIEEMHASAELGSVELHWRLALNTHQFSLEPALLLQRGQKIELAGEVIQVMQADDLLLYLCEHGSRHGWSRLKWLVDLPFLLGSQDWDWSALFAKARAAGCEKTLALGLELSRCLLGWSMPEQAALLVNRTRFLGWARRLAVRIQQAPETLGQLPIWEIVPHMARVVTLMLLLTPNAASVRRQVWLMLLSPSDLNVVRVPDRAFGLYYVLRPFLMIYRRVIQRSK
jgi:hypothetical protein